MQLNTSTARHFSLADLEAYDPGARGTNARGERRFLCPLCGDGKKRDTAHRCLVANMNSGAWRCWRGECAATGKLTDFWQDRPAETFTSGRTRARDAMARAFALPPLPTTVEEPHESSDPNADKWRAAWCNATPLLGTPAAEYLEGRSLSPRVAAASGACYSPKWHGAPAVVFPVTGQTRKGGVIAAQGRHLAGSGKYTHGDKQHGVYRAPARVGGRWWSPFDKDLPAVIITEGPADALSIATCGFPAIALLGTSFPLWLPRVCAFRRVLIATDADDAGDAAAGKLSDALNLGTTIERLRASELCSAAKDWNDALVMWGRKNMRDFLAERALMTDAERAAYL